MKHVAFAAVWFWFAVAPGTAAAGDEKPAPPGPERIKELVKALEVPIRMRADNTDGPPDGSWPKFHYRWYTEEILELNRAGEAAVPALMALLEDKTKAPQARAQAAGALMERLTGAVAKHDPKIIEALNRAMKENEPSLRFGLLVGMAPNGLGVNRADWESWKRNAEKTEASGQPHPKYGALWQIQNRPPPEKRSFTVEVMEALLPQVIASLSDEHPEVVERAAVTILFFGCPKKGVPELLAALKRQKGEVLVTVGCALTSVGKDDPDVLKAVLGLLKSERDKPHFASVVGMPGVFGPAAKDAVPTLIDILKDDRWAEKEDASAYIYEKAIVALGQIGAAAKPAGPAIFARLEATNRARRNPAYEALDKLDPELGKEARARQQRRFEESQREFEERNRPVPPVIRPIFPPNTLPPVNPRG